MVMVMVSLWFCGYRHWREKKHAWIDGEGWGGVARRIGGEGGIELIRYLYRKRGREGRSLNVKAGSRNEGFTGIGMHDGAGGSAGEDGL